MHFSRLTYQKPNKTGVFNTETYPQLVYFNTLLAI